MVTFIEHHFSTLLFAVFNILAIDSMRKPVSLNAMALFFTSVEYDLRWNDPLFSFLPSLRLMCWLFDEQLLTELL